MFFPFVSLKHNNSFIIQYPSQRSWKCFAEIRLKNSILRILFYYAYLIENNKKYFIINNNI